MKNFSRENVAQPVWGAHRKLGSGSRDGRHFLLVTFKKKVARSSLLLLLLRREPEFCVDTEKSWPELCLNGFKGCLVGCQPYRTVSFLFLILILPPWNHCPVVIASKFRPSSFSPHFFSLSRRVLLIPSRCIIIIIFFFWFWSLNLFFFFILFYFCWTLMVDANRRRRLFLDRRASRIREQLKV